MNTAAILLAAGSSSRLGQPKQKLAHEHGTLLHNAIAAAAGAGCSPIIVVTGAIKLASDIPGVTITHNNDWAAGMGGSIRRGVDELLRLAPEIDRTLILVCDQPALSTRVLAELLACWDRSQKPSVACVYADSVGPPCGFNRSRFDALLDLPPDRGAKALLLNPDETVVLDWPPGAIDIDTPDDLRRWRDADHAESTELDFRALPRLSTDPIRTS